MHLPPRHDNHQGVRERETPALTPGLVGRQNCPIRDDSGYWNQLEAYLVAHSEADFTHGMCSDCQEQMRERLTARPGPSEAPVS